jgi:hypothetical protein
MLRLYQDLIALRKQTPALANARKDLTRVACSETDRWLTVARSDPGGSAALLVANLSGKRQPIPLPHTLGSLTLALDTSAAIYGGDGPAPVADPDTVTLRPWSAVIYRSA